MEDRAMNKKITAQVIKMRAGDKDAIAIGGLCVKAKTSMMESIGYLIEAGQRLIDKKASLEHGEWLPWLKANAKELGFSDRTARRLIEVAGNRTLTSVLDETTALRISRHVWGNDEPSTTKTKKTKTAKKPKPTENAANDDAGEEDSDEVIATRALYNRAREAYESAKCKVDGVVLDEITVEAVRGAANAWDDLLKRVLAAVESGNIIQSISRPTRH
jgi:hypothetical protein